VNQGQYGIHILLVAPQEYINIYSTRRLSTCQRSRLIPSLRLRRSWTGSRPSTQTGAQAARTAAKEEHKDHEGPHRYKEFGRIATAGGVCARKVAFVAGRPLRLPRTLLQRT